MNSKKFKERDKKIIQLIAQGSNVEELSKRFKVSKERIRQIISPLKKMSSDEIQEKYQTALKYLSRMGIEYEIRRLSSTSRKKENVLQRKLLIKFLRDKYHYSFIKIGNLLNRDHTSIINLYTKK